MRRAILAVALVLAAGSSARADEAAEPPPRYVLGVSYGQGLNLWPNHGDYRTARFSDLSLTLGVGTPVGQPGGVIELEVVRLAAHNDQSESETLIGGSFRLVPWGHTYLRLRASSGLNASDATGATVRTEVFGVALGAAALLGDFDAGVEIGWLFGEHRDNGYMNLVEARVVLYRWL